MCHRSRLLQVSVKSCTQIGHLRKFNRAREIEFNFFIVWTIFIKFGTRVYHVHDYKMVASEFLIFA